MSLLHHSAENLWYCRDPLDRSESIPGYDETDVPSCVIQVVLGGGSPPTWQSRTPPLLFEKVKAGGKGAWNDGP